MIKSTFPSLCQTEHNMAAHQSLQKHMVKVYKKKRKPIIIGMSSSENKHNTFLPFPIKCKPFHISSDNQRKDL